MTWNALLCRAQSLDAFPLATSRKSVARRQTDLAGRHHLTAARVLVSSGFQSSTHCTTPLSRMGGERKKKEKMREKEPKKREFMYQKGPTPDFEAPVGGGGYWSWNVTSLISLNDGASAFSFASTLEHVSGPRFCIWRRNIRSGRRVRSLTDWEEKPGKVGNFSLFLLSAAPFPFGCVSSSHRTGAIILPLGRQSREKRMEEKKGKPNEMRVEEEEEEEEEAGTC